MSLVKKGGGEIQHTERQTDIAMYRPNWPRRYSSKGLAATYLSGTQYI